MQVLFLAFVLSIGLGPTEFPVAAAQMPHHGAPTLDEPAANPAIRRDFNALPAAVQDMRLSILAAAASGDLNEIRIVLERNEIMPVLSATQRVADPLAHFKARSADGEGAQLMAMLIDILTVGFVVVPTRDNEMYVWPHFAETGVQDLHVPELVELYRLAPPDRVAAMRAAGRYDHYRLGIGRDGTWHFFHDDE
jgi:hypothetical protein